MTRKFSIRKIRQSWLSGALTVAGAHSALSPLAASLAPLNPQTHSIDMASAMLTKSFVGQSLRAAVPTAGQVRAALPLCIATPRRPPSPSDLSSCVYALLLVAHTIAFRTQIACDSECSFVIRLSCFAPPGLRRLWPGQIVACLVNAHILAFLSAAAVRSSAFVSCCKDTGRRPARSCAGLLASCCMYPARSTHGT
jgi:hypothetical protein